MWYRNSLKLGYWSFGRSDIDITVLLKVSNSSLIKEINHTHYKLKKYLPIIGEVVFFSENLKDTLFRTINSLELKRDPDLIKKFSYDKNFTDVDKILFLHKFIIANSGKFKEIELRNKKIIYLMDSLQIKLTNFTQEEIVAKLAELNGANVQSFTKEYFYFLNSVIYPGDPVPEINSLYALFFNKICFLNFPRTLSDSDKELLESTILWELWGCYSNQTYKNEEQVRKHINNIFSKLNSFFPEEKVNSLKRIAIDLELLN